MTRPTEEQIEAALHAWNWQSTGVSENEAMKRALNAALSVPVEGEVEEMEAVARAICGVAFPGAEDHTDYKGKAQWKEFIPEAEAVLRALSARPVGEDDEDISEIGKLVAGFAEALKQKLHQSEEKYDYQDGWLEDGWRGDLLVNLVHHLEKGDPRDVAAYCAFAWHHAWSLTGALEAFADNGGAIPAPQREEG